MWNKLGNTDNGVAFNLRRVGRQRLLFPIQDVLKLLA